MKKYFIVLFCSIIAFYCNAQEQTKIEVPKKVKDKVLFLFPHTIDAPVTWSKEGDYYKASLIAWEAPANAVLDSLGNLISMEKRLNEKYLPSKVKSNLLKEYPGATILMAFEKTNAKGEKSYITEVQLKTSFLYDAKGNKISEIKTTK